MTAGWTLRRFWKEVSLEATPSGFMITLDGRPIRTPGKAPFLIPGRGLAELVVEEWRAQDGEVRPGRMPATRMVNTAIDKVSPHRSDVIAELAGYGETDLVCYRADAPEELRLRQAAGWDPLMTWTEERFGARLVARTGIMPIRQPAVSLASLAREVARQDDFELSALNDLVALSGSLVIALAVIDAFRSADDAWDLSRIDETWQAEQWGQDEEALAALSEKRAAFLRAARFHALCDRAQPGSSGSR